MTHSIIDQPTDKAATAQASSRVRSDVQRHQQYAQRLETLNEVGSDLSTATTEQEVFNIVAKAIQDVLLTDRVSYVIPNYETRDCRISLLTGNDAIPQSAVLPLDGSSIELVVDSQAPICFPHLASTLHPEHARLVAQGLVQACSTPILAAGEIIGVLNAAKTTAWDYPNEALALLTALGRFMGTTLERLRGSTECC